MTPLEILTRKILGSLNSCKYEYEQGERGHYHEKEYHPCRICGLDCIERIDDEHWWYWEEKPISLAKVSQALLNKWILISTRKQKECKDQITFSTGIDFICDWRLLNDDQSDRTLDQQKESTIESLLLLFPDK